MNCPIMKKLYIICLLTFIWHLAIAQNKITGRITDEKTGEAIAGATVYIPELKTSTFADKNGEYKIENLPQTNVIIQVSFLGYKSVL